MNNKYINGIGIKSQKGFTLLEVSLAAALLSAASIMTFGQKASELEVDKAKQIGTLLSQYNDAAQRWAQDNPEALALGAPPLEKKGTSWLKASSCGGLSEAAYLPCNFPELSEVNPSSFGNVHVNSTIRTIEADPNYEIRVETDTSPFLVGKDKTPRPDLSGIAALTASAASTAGSIKSSATTSRVTMEAGNVASTDPWLRTDGLNKMNAPIGFDESISPSRREITGLSRISAKAGQNLSIFGSKVVVDADQELYGKLSVKGGDIDVESGGINASGKIESSTEVKGRNLVATNEVKGENLVATTEIAAPTFYDSKNRLYKIDPSGTSRINITNTNTLTVANSASINNAVLSGTASFSGDAKVTGRLHLPLASVNGSCTTGTIGRDSGGKILSCESSKWKLALADQQPPAPTYKSCPTNRGNIAHGRTVLAEKDAQFDSCNYYMCHDGTWNLTGRGGNSCTYTIP